MQLWGGIGLDHLGLGELGSADLGLDLDPSVKLGDGVEQTIGCLLWDGDAIGAEQVLDADYGLGRLGYEEA